MAGDIFVIDTKVKIIILDKNTMVSILWHYPKLT